MALVKRNNEQFQMYLKQFSTEGCVKNMSSVDIVIGENSIEHILSAIKESLKRTAEVVCSIIDREE